MDNELMRKVHVTIGLFVIGCVAASYFYGWQPIVICLIGLFVVAAILNAYLDGPGGRQ